MVRRVFAGYKDLGRLAITPLSPSAVSDYITPASGLRNISNGALNNGGSNGYYWGASPVSATNGRNLNFNGSNVNPMNNNNRGYGFPVRPLQEYIHRMCPSPIESFGDRLRDDLFQAYFNARKNKRNTHSQLRFEVNLETNLFELHDELLQQTYQPRPAVCFVSHHPVDREVFASQFRDRVVHHLLFSYIAPIFERTFIHDSYSCRVGKGTLSGVERLEHHIRSCTENHTRTAYVLKLDIQGYFMSIDKEVLYGIIKERMEKHWQKTGVDSGVPGRNPLFIDYLIRTILFRDPRTGCIRRGTQKEWDRLPASKTLFAQPEGVGLPIGDLTSQLFSNIYLSLLDDYVKRELHVKHYGRYVDDFYIVHTSKRHLADLVPQIREFLWERLHLRLHPKKIYLQPCTHGVPFLGAVVLPYRRNVQRRTVKNFRISMEGIKRMCRVRQLSRQQVAHIRARINSHLGYLAAFRTFNLRRSIVASNDIARHFYFQHQCRLAKPDRRYSKIILNDGAT